MKRNLFIPCLIFVLFCPLNLLGQWSFQYNFPSPGGPWTNTRKFVDAVFISELSGISHSYYWNSPSSGGGYDTHTTTDGGTTWNLLSSVSTPYPIPDIFDAVPDQNTFIKQATPGVSTYYLYKSVNNNFTWTQIGTHSGLYKMSVRDANCFFTYMKINSNPWGTKIGKYKNGSYNSSFDTIPYFYASYISYASENAIYIIGSDSTNNRILKSVNGGLQWDTIYTSPVKQFNNLYAASNNVVYFLEASDSIMRTLDGGSSWQSLPVGSSFPLRHLYFVNDSVGLITGDAGRIFRTTDYGNSWIDESFSSTSYSHRLVCVNDSICLFILKDPVSSNYVYGELYKRNINQPLGIWDPVVFDEGNVYPNPAYDILNINTSEITDRVAVFELTGKVVIDQIVNSKSFQADVSMLRNGLYMVECYKGGNVLSRKKIMITK